MRVFIAEDQMLIRRGIEQLLRAHNVTVVGTADTAEGLADIIRSSAADLALLDIRMPPRHSDDGIQVAQQLRQRSPGFPVVMLSQYVEQIYVDELLAAGHGGVGYLLKDRVFDEARFVHCVRRVAEGDTVLDEEIVARLEKSRPADGALSQLTPREYTTLGYMAAGLSNEDIARRMVVTEKAVAKHINSIFAKLSLGDEVGNSRRVRAVLAYLRR